jgi:DedD protein
MAASQDTEITLGTGKLLLLFFTLVGICALFFALGYTLGRKSEPAITTASAAMPQTMPSMVKPASAPPMTFYKAVEQKDANPELTPPPDAKSDTSTAPDTSSAQPQSATNPVESATLPSSAAYFVQVAAVSKQEDAGALVDALKKKSYPAFVAAQAATDKLFRVQVGPFSEVKDAEAMRTHLISDGYSPILKR